MNLNLMQSRIKIKLKTYTAMLGAQVTSFNIASEQSNYPKTRTVMFINKVQFSNRKENFSKYVLNTCIVLS